MGHVKQRTEGLLGPIDKVINSKAITLSIAIRTASVLVVKQKHEHNLGGWKHGSLTSADTCFPFYLLPSRHGDTVATSFTNPSRQLVDEINPNNRATMKVLHMHRGFYSRRFVSSSGISDLLRLVLRMYIPLITRHASWLWKRESPRPRVGYLRVEQQMTQQCMHSHTKPAEVLTSTCHASVHPTWLHLGVEQSIEPTPDHR